MADDLNDNPDDTLQNVGDEINLAVRELVAERLAVNLEEHKPSEMSGVIIGAIAGIVSAAGGLCAAFEPGLNGDVLAGVVQDQFNAGREDQRAISAKQEEEAEKATSEPLPGLPGGAPLGSPMPEAPRPPNVDEEAKLYTAVEILRNALQRALPDAQDYLQLGITAGAVLSGSVYGHAVVAGLEEDTKPRRRELHRLLKTNFQAGVVVSLSHGARVMKENGQVN